MFDRKIIPAFFENQQTSVEASREGEGKGAAEKPEAGDVVERAVTER